MSAAESSSSNLADDLSDEVDRKVVLKMLEGTLKESHDKVKLRRVYNAENEKVRQKWYETLGYLVGQFRQMMKGKTSKN